jgi:Fe-S cluster assembly iron-binding protein IscA
MALDEPKETDMTFTIGGFDYVVDKALLTRTQPISIDYTRLGFRVTSQRAPGNGSLGCS